jgi:hypothetical protein
MTRWILLGAATLTPTLLWAQASVIRGRITDARSRRLVASVVELRAADTTIVRDGASTYLITALPAGRFELVVRAIGYQSLTLRVELAPNDTLVADVELERIATRLAKVRTDSAVSPEGYRGRLAEFEERRAAGFGYFRNWRFFESRQHLRLAELLDGQFPGLKVDKTKGSGGRLTTRRSGQFCAPQIFVNGVLDDSFSLDRLSAAEVVALEYYTPSTTPPRYNLASTAEGGGVLRGNLRGSACGTVLFWLR